MRTLLVLLLSFLMVGMASADMISSSIDDLVDFENGTEVSTTGELIDAVNFGNSDIDSVINGVNFKGTINGYYHEDGDSYGDATTLYLGGNNYASNNDLFKTEGAYHTIANSQLYSAGVGIVNLVPGTVYEMQIFVFDDRSDINKSFTLDLFSAQFSGDPAGNGAQWESVDSTTMGGVEVLNIGGGGNPAQVITMTFSIRDGWNGMVLQPDDSGNVFFCGLQLRKLFEMTPIGGQDDVSIDGTFSWSFADNMGFDPEYSITYDLYMDPNATFVGQGLSTCEIVSEGLESASFTPASSLPFETTYFWGVKAHVKFAGEAEAVVFDSPVISFTSEADNMAPIMEAGQSVVTWVDNAQAGILLETATLDDFGEGDTSVEWSLVPNFTGFPADISFVDASAVNPVVMIQDAGVYRLKVVADDSVNPTSTDYMQITVYTDACEAAKKNPAGGYQKNPYDYDDDCMVSLNDFSMFASEWLSDTFLTEPATYDMNVNGSMLTLWLDASNTDSVTLVDGRITRWDDISGNGNYLETGGTAGDPNYVIDSLNGLPTVDFGPFKPESEWSQGQWMQFKNANGDDLNISNIRTAFIVTRGTNFILGDDNNYHFHRGGETPDSNLWAGWASGNILNGQTYLNGQSFNGQSNGLPVDFSLVSFVTTGNVEASRLACDRTYRSGGQEVAELLIFDTALSDSDRQTVEAYLMKKWFNQ